MAAYVLIVSRYSIYSDKHIYMYIQCTLKQVITGDDSDDCNNWEDCDHLDTNKLCP